MSNVPCMCQYIIRVLSATIAKPLYCCKLPTSYPTLLYQLQQFCAKSLSRPTVSLYLLEVKTLNNLIQKLKHLTFYCAFPFPLCQTSPIYMWACIYLMFTLFCIKAYELVAASALLYTVSGIICRFYMLYVLLVILHIGPKCFPIINLI